MKKFNTAGTCFPDRHYMVDISERIRIISEMIGEGDYFCINRGRQYGKTTTLQAIKSSLSSDYAILSISLEGLGENSFRTDEAMAYTFIDLLLFRMMWDRNRDEGIFKLLQETKSRYTASEIPLNDLSSVVSDMCSVSRKPVVLLVDEVDQSGNYPSFLQFLGLLRKKFLERVDIPTFQSVILAGVYDVKNLKLKIRPEGEHQYNSPWNIAVPFDVDMSFHPDGIAGMLAEYSSEHSLDFNIDTVSEEIYDYTHGYPFMVSRLCQIIDSKGYDWNHPGVVNAVHDLLNEENTLFDDMVKKMDDFPELKKLIRAILYCGERKNVSLDEKFIQLGLRFSFLRNDGGVVKIANRILETRLYNFYAAEDQNDAIFTRGSIDKSQFIHGGMLDVRRLIERFTVNFNEIYSDKDESFVERHGRQFFLLYLKPVINGIGNYYIEAETRDETRTDIVIDYLGHQYVIETKIWRGNSYNEKGEKQLSEYLDYFHLDTGYLVSFCFNKNKRSGVHKVTVGGKTVFEAVV